MQLDLFDAPLPPVVAPATLAPLPPPSPGGRPGRKTPHYYQVDVVRRARAQIAKGKRKGLIQGETGCGKTLVEVMFAEGAHQKNRRALFFADRRRLVSQICAELDGFGVPYGVIMDGSTRGVSSPIIVASRDTLYAWLENGCDLPQPDLVGLDEAHKGMGDRYQKLSARWPHAVHLGFTATPARSDGRALSGFYQWIECVVPTSELIRNGYLVRPEVWAPRELALRRKEGSKTKGLAGNPVTHWLEHAKGLPTIAFARKVAESVDLVKRFNDAGIPAEHVDASTPDDDSPLGREAAYKRLANGQTMVLSSVGLLIEGVDIPEASAAIIWAPFGSLVQWRQACGRVMRPCPRIGKTRAVILDHSGAAGIHGAPGTDMPWSLDPNSTLQQRLKEAIERGDVAATVYCPSCGLAFQAAPQCPSCGWRPKGKTKAAGPAEDAYEARDEVLSRFDDEDARQVLAETRGRYWAKCIAIAIRSGKTAGSAAAMFSRKFGVPPWSAGMSPLPAGADGDPTRWRRSADEAFPEFIKEKAG